MSSLKFHMMYKPLTSRPFLADQTYMEYQPCEKLLPYVACYWEMGNDKKEEQAAEVLVIPDTCMDIIVHINHSRGTVEGYLCGMQDKPFVTVQSGESKDNEDMITSFAIRFHFWSASLFMKLNFKDAYNQFIELGDLGAEWVALFETFLHITGVKERIVQVEAFLLAHLWEMEKNATLFNSIQRILASSGCDSIKEICAYSCVSQRQIERLFQLEVGISPKRAANLVRYQNVWREIAMKQVVDIHEVALRYGYTDQAHLLKEFKRFHGVTTGEAKRIADMYRVMPAQNKDRDD